MSKEALRGVVADIKEVALYSIIVDETRDRSGKVQLVFCLRWVSSCYEVFEDFIGLVHVEATDATTLKRVIQDCPTRCALPLLSCRGQEYDGAANMAGHLNGVAGLFKKEPKALFVHCMAHSINLCLQECGKQAKVIRDSLSLVQELCNYCHPSA